MAGKLVDEIREATREANGTVKDLIRERKATELMMTERMKEIEDSIDLMLDGIGERLGGTVRDYLDRRMQDFGEEVVLKVKEHIDKQVNTGVRTLREAHAEFLVVARDISEEVGSGQRKLVATIEKDSSVDQVMKRMKSQRNTITATSCGPWDRSKLSIIERASLPEVPDNATKQRCKVCGLEIWASRDQMKLIRTGMCHPLCFPCTEAIEREADIHCTELINIVEEEK